MTQLKYKTTICGRNVFAYNGDYYAATYHNEDLKWKLRWYPIFRFKPGNLAFKLVQFLAKAPKPMHRNQVLDGVWENIPMEELLNRMGDTTVYVNTYNWDGKVVTFKGHDTWNCNLFTVARRLGYIDYSKAGWIATPKGKAMVRRKLRALKAA